MEKIKNEIVDATEFDVAEKEAKVSVDAFTCHFAKPVEYEGKEYCDINFNWGKLTGADSLAIEAELQSIGRAVVAPEFSGEYLARMAAKASEPRVGVDFIQALPITEFNRIRNRARSFLLKSAL